MFSKLFLAAALAHFATAEWLIQTDTEPEFSRSYSNVAEATSVLGQIESEISEYAATKTADPSYQSAISDFEDYVATRTDAPESLLLASDTTTLYTTEPGWWRAMPTEIQQVFLDVKDDQLAIASSIMFGDAPRPTAAAQYLGVGMAAAAAGAAILL